MTCNNCCPMVQRVKRIRCWKADSEIGTPLTVATVSDVCVKPRVSNIASSANMRFNKMARFLHSNEGFKPIAKGKFGLKNFEFLIIYINYANRCSRRRDGLVFKIVADAADLLNNLFAVRRLKT